MSRIRWIPCCCLLSHLLPFFRFLQSPSHSFLLWLSKWSSLPFIVFATLTFQGFFSFSFSFSQSLIFCVLPFPFSLALDGESSPPPHYYCGLILTNSRTNQLSVWVCCFWPEDGIWHDWMLLYPKTISAFRKLAYFDRSSLTCSLKC